MGKDSAYYKNKKKKQTLKLRELMSQLPGCAKDFLYDKEETFLLFFIGSLPFSNSSAPYSHE